MASQERPSTPPRPTTAVNPAVYRDDREPRNIEAERHELLRLRQYERCGGGFRRRAHRSKYD